MSRPTFDLARALRALALLAALAGATGAQALPPVQLPPGGPGPIVIGPGPVEPPPPPPPITITRQDLIDQGYTCRPYGAGYRCDLVSDGYVLGSNTRFIWLCPASDGGACDPRSQKVFPAQVPANRYDAWALPFVFGPGAIALEDFDGDGAAELAAFMKLAGADVLVGRSNGENEFGPPTLWSDSFCGPLTATCLTGHVTGAPSDILAFDTATGDVTVAFSTGSAFAPATGPVIGATNAVWNSEIASFGSAFLVGDFDGDGLDDAAVISNGSQAAAGPTGSAFVFLNRSISRLVGRRFASPGQNWLSSVCPNPAECRVGDFDGDGRDDIVRIKSTGAVAVATSTGTGFRAIDPPVFEQALAVEPATTTTFQAATTTSFQSTATATFEPTATATIEQTATADLEPTTTAALLPPIDVLITPPPWSTTLGAQAVAFHVADVNQDGFDDLLGIRADGGLVVGISDGASFDTTILVDEMYCAVPASCRVGDVNADGYPDLLEYTQGAIGLERPGDVWVSLGGPLRGFPAPPDRPQLPDQDGDGVPDRADNCIEDANPLQEDADRDGFGNACEHKADTNGDGQVNLADLAYVRSKLFTNDAKADLNKDGIVNLLDVAILKEEFLKPPGPSAALEQPVLEVHGLVNGTIFDPGSEFVWVGGFVKNVAPVDAALRVRSNGSTRTIAVQPDGFFSAFVRVNPSVPLNPVTLEVERKSAANTSPRKRTRDRRVAVIGRSVGVGELSPASLAARIQDWQIQEIADDIAANFDLEELERDMLDGYVLIAEVTGPLTLDVRPFSDQIVVDLFLPGISVRVDEACDVTVHMEGIHGHMVYDLRKDRFNPQQVQAIELPGSPAVTFDDVFTGSHPCSVIGDIVADVEGRARTRIEAKLRSSEFEFNQGPVDGAIEDKLNSLDLSGALASIGVTMGTEFSDVREDIVGVTLELDTSFVPANEGPVRTEAFAIESFATSPVPTFPGGFQSNLPPRIYQTGAVVPTFPLWTSEGELFDIALGVAPDMLNQLFDAATRSGKLAEEFAQLTQDCKDGLPTCKLDLAAQNPDAATFLPVAGLDTIARLVPTLPPVATGTPGPNGELTEIRMGQLMFEIPKLDGTDAVRIALDLRGTLDVNLHCPLLGGNALGLVIRVRILEVLAAETLRVTDFRVEQLVETVRQGLLEAFVGVEVSVAQPLPSFEGFRLELFDVQRNPNGSAFAFARLDFEDAPPYQGEPACDSQIPTIDLDDVLVLQTITPSPTPAPTTPTTSIDLGDRVLEPVVTSPTPTRTTTTTTTTTLSTR